MPDQFLLPKDARLSLRMLIPSFRRKHLPEPAGGSPTHYLFWARNAVYHGLRALSIQPGENVLAPSYHCTSVVEPILQYGGAVKFYNIGPDLKPDLSDIHNKIDRKTRAVLVIHYFGFPQPIVRIKEFCRDRGLYLIEDCAHVLVGQTEEGIPLGTLGDISIFSWRKFLPVYDGGQLVINNASLKLDTEWASASPLFSLKIAKNLVDKIMQDSDSALVNLIAKLSHAPSVLFCRIAEVNGYGDSMSTVNNYDLDFDLASANLKMSWLSRYIICNTDISDVAEKRRRNYDVFAHGVKSMAGVKPLHPSLPKHTVPWVFPLLSCGMKDLHLKLRERGIPATNWSGVIHSSLPLDRYPESRYLYDNIVFLPIHQSLQKYEIETMLRILGEVLGETVTDAESFDDRLSLSAVSGG